jgi:spermidine synthase
MSTLQPREDPGNPSATGRDTPLTAVFSITILLSAALLFMVQPMVARMILPRLGGTPATWNTCLLFFQTALLAGYLYVHLAATRLRPRTQLLFHLAIVVSAVFTLPVALPVGAPADGRHPAGWLLAALVIAVGLPFFALSTTAPLLQRWFTLRSARDPYFLYAASNAGSLVGLLAYPFVVEPLVTLADQRTLWSIGFLVVAALIVGCGVVTLKTGDTVLTAAAPRGDDRDVSDERWSDRLRWLALSFVPSSLLLGVTTHISTDVAAVPLLWVVPLTLYLATFVVAFASRPPVSRVWMSRLAPFVIFAAMARVVLTAHWWSAFVVHLIAFAVVALVCHRELAERRPAAGSLTRFYLWVSIGGALGGLFNALIAPVVFTQVIEYPLVLVLAALIRPSPEWRGNSREPAPLLWGALVLALAIATVASVLGLTPDIELAAMIVAVGLCVGFGLAFANRRVPFAAALATILVAHFVLPHQQSNRVLYAARSFFGVHRVTSDTPSEVQRLYHGTTLHGWQRVSARERCEPTSYYHRSGPIGQLLTTLGDRARSMALIGLGAGALACYGRDETALTFYEIDPVVERIARDARLFTYLENARGSVNVVIGDGRVSLARAAPATYDVIVVDAFSSDSIPVHLMTREFVALAFERLGPAGLLAFHISNRHLDLAPVLGAAARDLGTEAVEQFHQSDDRDASPSRWLVIGQKPGDLAFLSSDSRWRDVRAAERSWTDDFSNILDVLQWSPEGAVGAR